MLKYVKVSSVLSRSDGFHFRFSLMRNPLAVVLPFSCLSVVDMVVREAKLGVRSAWHCRRSEWVVWYASRVV